MLIPRDELIKQNARLEEVRDEIIAELMKIPGVISVSDGVKRVGGSLIPEICIKVTVEKKKNIHDITPSERIPPEIKGFKTDVEEQYDVKLLNGTEKGDESKYRPLVGGIQVGSNKSSLSGTLGCFATVNTGTHAGKKVLLSNFHVLCNGAGTVGDDARVGQPTHNGCCSCCECDEVGQVIDAEVVDAHLDAAIARIFTGGDDPKDIRHLENAIIDIGYVAGAGPIVTANTRYSVMPGEMVYKRGRSTLISVGTVSQRGFTTPAIEYNKVPLVTYIKTDQMEIEPTADYDTFSKEGDSGSVIVNAKNEVVGLLFASNPVRKLTLANHIDYVTTRFNITIINSMTEAGLPVSTLPRKSLTTIQALTDNWMTDAEKLLYGTNAGNTIRMLIKNHQQEIRDLIRTNREVRYAWNRYSGPAFLNHIARSIRDDHSIPATIQSNTLETLIIKMTAVFIRHGSESLVCDVEDNYVHLLEIISSGNRFKDWLEKMDLTGKNETATHSAITT